MTETTSSYLRDTALALSAITVASAAVAVAVASGDPAHARAVLRYGFAPIPRQPEQVLTILRANSSVLIPFLAMALVVQIRRVCKTRLGARVFTTFCDVIVLAPALHNLIVVLGESIGAYGARMLRATLPAGPIELLAYALAASVYLQSRRTPMPLRQGKHAAAVALLGVTTLAVAALVETYLSA